MSEMLLKHFDLLATAPGGVARLRELILTLAVRGKLVPQDPSDEPASVLLQKIRAEKDRLIAEGRIKRDKPLAPIAHDKLPCELPQGWTWARLTELGEFLGGKTPSTQRSMFWDGDIPWITPKDMKQLRLSDSEDKVTQQAVDDGLALVPPQSVLVVVRSGILRRTVPTAVNEVATTINQDLKALVLVCPELAAYVQLIIRGFERFILLNLTKVGTTVESIQFDAFAAQPFPIPPLAEQSRIVARVEELMRLCDALEAKGKLDAAQHTQLVQTLLDTLTDSASPVELAANWQRVAEHFDLLLDRPEAVDALEQTILQLAVRGLLVPQDPSDEPASVLLQKIRTEKDRLIAEGKIKRDKPLAPITDEEKPFEVPAGWEWARMGELVNSSEAGWSPSCINTPRRAGHWGVLKVSAVSWGKFDPEANKELPPDLVPRPEFEVKASDFLLSRANTEELVARSVVVGTTPVMLMLSDKIIRLDVSSQVNRAFLNLCNNSAHSRAHYITHASGTSSSMKNVSREVVLNLPVALAPAAEQSHIVARVEELRQLCSDLRQRLTASRTTQVHLAEALVAAVVSPEAS